MTELQTRADQEPLLRVASVSKSYPFTKGVLFARTLGQVRAVDGVSFAIRAGETPARETRELPESAPHGVASRSASVTTWLSRNGRRSVPRIW